MDELTWHLVQERLDDQSRVTNRTGSTTRKHLGSSLYLCGVCDEPVRAHTRGYRCPGHLTRSRPPIGDWAVSIVRERLTRPDLLAVLPSKDEPRLTKILAAISSRQGRIKRAQHGYDEETIQGTDLKRIRDRENAAIADLEVERLRLALGSDLSDVLGDGDPVAAFDRADVTLKRRKINFTVEVCLYPHPQGMKGFNPHTVKVTPKRHQTR